MEELNNSQVSTNHQPANLNSCSGQTLFHPVELEPTQPGSIDIQASNFAFGGIENIYLKPYSEINLITGKPYKRSPEFRAKASVRNKGKKLSEETKQKISKSMTGHKVKIETKVKLSKALSGIARPEEVKAKISATKQANKNKDISSHYNT